jgi:uncharacterized protein DUF6627
MNTFRRYVAAILMVCIAGLGLPLPAQAAIVTSEEAGASVERAAIAEFLARSEVRDALAARGVSPQAAQARVDALSAAEAQQLARDIDRLPAAGTDVLGLLLTVFIVLLVTDILGFTKVFPFTRSIR